MKRHVNVVDWTDKAAVRVYRAMKAREYYRKNRDKILSKLRNMSEDDRKRYRACSKRFRQRNHDRLLEKYRSRSDEQKERKRELNRKYRMIHREERNSANRRYHAKLVAELIGREDGSYERYRKEMRAYNDLYMTEVRERCETDPEFYAEWRRKRREIKRRAREKAGKVYRPLPSRRIPDSCKMGDRILDETSVFIHCNLPKDLVSSVRAYAIRRNIERFGDGTEVRE